MKFINVRDFRTKSSKIWKELKENDEIIISSNGRPIALLSNIDEKNIDIVIQAFRKTKAMLALDKLQKDSVKKGTSKIKSSEIEKEISDYRKESI